MNNLKSQIQTFMAELRPQLQPRPDWLAQSREQLSVYLRSQPVKQAATSQAVLATYWQSLCAWQPVSIGLTILCLLLISGTGTVMAASNALPGELLYSVKRASEAVALSLTPSPSGKQELADKFQERRRAELAQLAQEIEQRVNKANLDLTSTNLQPESSKALALLVSRPSGGQIISKFPQLNKGAAANKADQARSDQAEARDIANSKPNPSGAIADQADSNSVLDQLDQKIVGTIGTTDDSASGNHNQPNLDELATIELDPKPADSELVINDSPPASGRLIVNENLEHDQPELTSSEGRSSQPATSQTSPTTALAESESGPEPTKGSNSITRDITQPVADQPLATEDNLSAAEPEPVLPGPTATTTPVISKDAGPAKDQPNEEPPQDKTDEPPVNEENNESGESNENPTENQPPAEETQELPAEPAGQAEIEEASQANNPSIEIR